jgi:prepilin peptidase CpaA
MKGNTSMVILLTWLITGIASIYDLKTRRIPNFITFSTIILGLIINSYSLEQFKQSIFGAGLGIVLLIIPFVLGVIGAGDVKLLAAVGALNGTQFLFQTFLYGSIAGGIIALAIAVLNKRLWPVLHNGTTISMEIFAFAAKPLKGNRIEPVNSGLRFPYGIAIFCGTVVTYWLR